MDDEEQDPFQPPPEEPRGFFPGPGQRYVGATPSNPDVADIVPDGPPKKPPGEKRRREIDATLAEGRRKGLLKVIQTPFGPMEWVKDQDGSKPDGQKPKPRFRWPWQKRPK